MLVEIGVVIQVSPTLSTNVQHCTIFLSRYRTTPLTFPITLDANLPLFRFLSHNCYLEMNPVGAEATAPPQDSPTVGGDAAASPA